MTKLDNPVANPLVVLREEFDDWAILFDPDSGKGYGLNPVCVFIWKHLDGHHSVDQIVEELARNCDAIPEHAASEVSEFINQLVVGGLAGYEVHLS